MYSVCFALSSMRICTCISDVGNAIKKWFRKESPVSLRELSMYRGRVEYDKGYHGGDNDTISEFGDFVIVY